VATVDACGSSASSPSAENSESAGGYDAAARAAVRGKAGLGGVRGLAWADRRGAAGVAASDCREINRSMKDIHGDASRDDALRGNGRLTSEDVTRGTVKSLETVVLASHLRPAPMDVLAAAMTASLLPVPPPLPDVGTRRGA